MWFIAQFNTSFVSVVFPYARAIENEQAGNKVKNEGTHPNENNNGTTLSSTTQHSSKHRTQGNPVHDERYSREQSHNHHVSMSDVGHLMSQDSPKFILAEEIYNALSNADSPISLALSEGEGVRNCKLRDAYLGFRETSSGGKVGYYSM